MMRTLELQPKNFLIIMLQDPGLDSMVLFMSTMNKGISKKDISKYRNKCLKYTSGKGVINPKWIKLPKIESSWMWDKKYDLLDEDLMTRLYPFKPGVDNYSKFRILAVQRFACLLGGHDQSYEYVKAIEEWMRQLVISPDSEKLRKALRLPEILEIFPVPENEMED